MVGKTRTWIYAVMVLWLIAGGAVFAATPRPIPIVLDTDIGSDIDDVFALALILKSPELNLRAVTTVSTDTQARPARRQSALGTVRLTFPQLC